NVTAVLGTGRKPGIFHVNTFKFDGGVLRQREEYDGATDATGAGGRRVAQLVYQRRPSNNRTFPSSILELTDSSEAATDAHRFTLCDANHKPVSDDGAYVTVNFADGTSLAHEYDDDAHRNMLRRLTDPRGVTTLVTRNSL